MEDVVVHEVFRDDGRSRSSACPDKKYGNIPCTKFIGVVALTRSFPRALFQNVSKVQARRAKLPFVSL